MKKHRIIIVVPAYNEATRIGAVIRSIPHQLSVDSDVFALKVVVVDDGSHDNTAAEAEKAGALVVRHVINCGAGAATRTGLRYAETYCQDATYVIAIDADGQHAPEDIKHMLGEAVKTNADMVVGNRLHAGNSKNIPRHRNIGNWGLTFISRMLFGIKVKDTQTGFRLFRTSVLPVVANYGIDRYGFATEMLWQATRHKLHIVEVPIAVTYSADTLEKGQSVWGAVDLIVSLFWIRISR
jgi:glycosyltransferase involved in cell wall biosynthesis